MNGPSFRPFGCLYGLGEFDYHQLLKADHINYSFKISWVSESSLYITADGACASREELGL